MPIHRNCSFNIGIVYYDNAAETKRNFIKNELGGFWFGSRLPNLPQWRRKHARKGEKMSFINFPDKSGNDHKSISALSLIVLRGTSNEIKKARNKYVEGNIHFVDFLETMTGDTYKEQLIKTANTEYEDLNFYGIIAFGEKEILDPITKRLSLWR